jgi:hypothetical protein
MSSGFEGVLEVVLVVGRLGEEAIVFYSLSMQTYSSGFCKVELREIDWGLISTEYRYQPALI